MPRPEHPFDRQLRSVPSRPGLEQRLREAAVDDEALDHWLGDVAEPAGLIERLRDAALETVLCEAPGEQQVAGRILEAVLDDDALDTALCDTPAATNLSPRLLDGVIEEALRETPPAPVTVTAAPPARARRPRPAPRWRGSLTAAALMALVLGLHWTALYQIAASMLPVAKPGETLLVADGGPLEVEARVTEPPRLEQLEQFVSTVDLQDPGTVIELDPWELPSRSGPYQRLAEALAGGLDLGEDLIAARIEHVGYPSRSEPPPPPVELVSRRSVGASPPLDRAYDRAFHWRYGVSPWVRADALPKQAISLAAEPRQFERVLWQLRQGRAVRPDEVRVEDALATLDPRFRMPSDGLLGIRTAAGPSYFHESGAGLLQVGVAAGAPARRLTSPVRLTVLLDVSEEMSLLDLAAARRELLAALRVLRPQDRLNIVTFGGPAMVLCEDAGLEQIEDVRVALESLRPAGLADWGRALPQALLTAVEGAEQGMRQEVVVVSSGRGEWRAAAEPFMNQALTGAQRRGVAMRIAVCRPSRQMRFWDWAQQRNLSWADQVGAVGDSLVRAICGQDATIAQDVRLQLEFNPQAVAAYRVIGSDSLASQWSDELAPVELRAGDQRCVLVEIVWRGGQQDTAGWAELRWQDREGTPQRRRQRISRLQLAPSFQQSASSLQAAMLTAEAAQILAKSPFAKGRSHTLKRVAAVAQECRQEVRGRVEIRRLTRSVGAAPAASSGQQEAR